MRTSFALRCCLLLWAVAGAIPATASTRDWSLREYVRTTWTHRNGLPLAPATSMTQTTDGYLWFIVGRSEALVRFDGVQFTPVPLPCTWVQSITADPGGGLWILCRDDRYQLFKRDATGVVEVPLTGVALNPGQPAPLFVDSKRRLWIYGDRVARRQPDGGFRELARLPVQGSRTAAEDENGALWFSDGKTVVRIHGDEVESKEMRGMGVSGTPASGVFATSTAGIYRLAGMTLSLLAPAPAGVTFASRHSIDSSGAIWAITQQHGIARVANGRVETLLSPGDEGSAVRDVFIDREDDIWVTSSTGLHRFRKPHARLLPSLGGRVPFLPMMVWADASDDVWVGNTQTVVRTNLASGHTQTFDILLPSGLARDHDGRIWLSSNAQLLRLDAGVFRPIVDASGAPIPRVRQMRNDANGDLWGVANGVGMYQLTPGKPRLAVPLPDAAADFLRSARHGMWVAMLKGVAVMQVRPEGEPIVHQLAVGPGIGQVNSISERGDAVWVGHSRGLSRWRNGRWTTWLRAHGLPGRGDVHEIVSDDQGRLWMLSDGGLLAVPEAELEATPDGAPRPLRFVRIGDLDRVVVHPGSPAASPRAVKDGNGRLYFATVDSVAVVDPASVIESSLRPTIALESALADGRPVNVSAPGRLTAPAKLQFDYTSLSLRSPETIRFRYKLEGYDADWIEAGGARQAVYGTLPPGPYRFRVIGSSSEGVWNEEGVSYAFSVVPLFYNTWWFRATALLFLAAAIVATYRLHMRRLTNQMQLQFEARLAERTRIARELHDTLLQGTLAASLHAQLADQALHKAPPSPAIEEVRSPLKQAVDLLAQVARDSRALLNGLRSAPATGDIAQLIQQAAGEQPNKQDIDFRVTVEGAARLLKPAIADDVVLIAREAVVNAFQHARARLVEVELIYAPNTFQCLVRDDGQGIDRTLLERGRDGHWGLAGMRERAERAGGALHVRSSATAGTEVHFSLTGRLAFADDATVPGRWRWRR
jgi:signal transduction histidine kinase/ligand-binding sensor domain-containing protein